MDGISIKFHFIPVKPTCRATLVPIGEQIVTKAKGRLLEVKRDEI